MTQWMYSAGDSTGNLLKPFTHLEEGLPNNSLVRAGSSYRGYVGRGAVLARTISSGRTVMVFGYGDFAGALMRRSKVSAAITPISRNGCRTVVKPGFWYAALWVSSEPTTERSSGAPR